MSDNGRACAQEHRLATPDNHTVGRRESGSPGRDRSRSRARSLLDRELDLRRERERIHTMEKDLQKEREENARWERSEQRRQEQRSSKRSCSPSFTVADVMQLISTLKSTVTSQPVNQSEQSNRHLDSKNMLPEFDPSTKNQRVDIWLRKINESASVYGWDEKTTIFFATQKLQGLAKTWYESLPSILFSWQEWQDKLLSAFPSEQNYGQVLEEMLRRRSRFNEPIEIYFYEKLSLLNRCDITGKRAVDCIIHGLTDRTMKSSALALRCTMPEQLLQFLMSNKDTTQQQVSFKGRGIGDHASYNSKVSHRTGNSSSVFCFNCKEKGHPYLQCPKPLLKCNKCNKVGHVSEKCFVNSQLRANKPEEVIQKTMLIGSSSKPDAKYFKKVIVDGVELEAYVDFGSDVTLVKESTIKGLGIKHDTEVATMKGFGNGVVQSLGSVSLMLSIDGVHANVSCRVVDDHFIDKPLLIGQTFTEQPHVVVYKDVEKLQFLDLGTEVPDGGSLERDPPLVRLKIAGHCNLYGVASVRAVTESCVTGNILVENKVIGKPNEQYVVCGGLHSVKQGVTYVVLIPCAIPCALHENAIISRAEKVEVVNRVALLPFDVILHNVTSESKNPVPKGVVGEGDVCVGEAASLEDRSKLFGLLKEYGHCFAQNLSELGCTNAAEMNIELKSKEPVTYRPYRLSHHERGVVREMIDEMLSSGIIRESVSSYSSPIILVRKKDGKQRMCVDYRMLNSVTIKERYPIPIIDDEIAKLSGQAWYITLDLMSGYYQVPISESSKHLTAFVTPDGQYEFNRMPFGLANAPSVFQRMMNRVLGRARFEKAMVYIDDLLIYGRTPEECLDRLEDVFRLLEAANLKLNLAKCSFLQTKIDYLGYEISAEGIRPGPAKIECVGNFPRPLNVHSVRQFLGLVSYFRKFIQGFAQAAHPLTKLLKKDATWEWAEEQETAYATLKKRLVDRPVLAIFDPTAELELHSDASKVGIGGILLQRSPKDGQLHPVAYYSRQTTPEEKNFHSYELETLAVVCSLKKFRVYLIGKEFKIITDCSALRSTFQKRDLVPRIARWWLSLQEFNCTVEYRAGRRMSHVDALSRNPCDMSGNVGVSDQCAMVLSISDEDWLLTLQLGDSELTRIRSIVGSDLDSKGLEYIKNNYVIRENKLFRCVGGDKENLRWAVPKGARWQVCRFNHDDIGHIGYEKTLERIQKSYWFPKMRKFVKKYVNACIECAYSKVTSKKNEGLLHPIPKVEKPFHTLHIDHLGPFVRSKKGNTHLLVVVDGFTKFVFIKPVKSTNTQHVIKVLEDIFDTFRNPDRLVSDRGSCFTSNAFKRFCSSRGIKHILNAVASPRANGQVERYNRTILDSLTAQNLRENEKEWDSKIGRIQWGLNNSLQKTIGRAPSEVMFGVAMNSEPSPILNEIVNETSEELDVTDIRNEVKDRIDREQDKQKHYYDANRKPARSYNCGDLVKITKTAFQNNGKSTKLMPAYEGPYKVIKSLGNDRYKVAPIPGFEGMRKKRKTTVAADRMHPWIHVAALEAGNDSDAHDSDGQDSE